MEQFSEEEVEQVDRFMDDHMYGHSISNSYPNFVCNPSCRKRALGMAINSVLKKREVTDMRKPGEAFCSDCPDHEACMSSYPCSMVKRVNKEAMKDGQG